jgi:hypothetical protein
VAVFTGLLAMRCHGGKQQKRYDEPYLDIFFDVDGYDLPNAIRFMHSIKTTDTEE